MDMWNSLAGYVMIKLEGAGLERFVNRALDAGLSIWNVKRTSRNTMTAYVSVGSFYALRKLNRSLGCSIHILEKHGLPIALSRLWFRKILALGWIGVLAALLLCSRYVWFFRFDGCDQVSPAQLMATLEDMGIRPGTPRGQVVTSQLGKAVMASDARIAWAGADLNGVVLQLSIQEAGQEPAVLEEGPPQSIYAARDGVIRRIVPLQGKALFQAGDAVLQGQKLITGELGEDLAVQARGEVIARVLYRFSYTAPYSQVAPGRTGETYTYIQLSLLGYTLPEPAIPFDAYEEEISQEAVLGVGVPLEVQTVTCYRLGAPLRVQEVTCYQLADMPRTFTQAELLPMAEAGARALMEQGVDKTARILSVQTVSSQDETGVTVELQVIAEENIAQSGAL